MEIQKYPAPKKVKFTVSKIQSKFTSHAKREANSIHNEEKNQSVFIKTYPDLTQILKFTNKGIKIVIIAVFLMFKKLSRDTKKIVKTPVSNFQK